MSDLSPETRDLLSRGRKGEELPSERRAKMRAAVLAKVALGSAGGASVAAPVGVATKSVKLVIVGVLALVGTGAVVAKYGSERSEVVTTTPTTIPHPSSDAKVGSVAPILLNGAKKDFVANSPTAPTIPTTSVATINSAPSNTIKAPPNATALSTTNTTTQTPRASSNDVSASGAGAGGGYEERVATFPATDNAASLLEEARLLREAHGALSLGDFQRSLTLLDDHARRFPESALEPERSAERVLVLCQMGRTDDARAAAKDFLRRHTSGPLATRVKASCGAP